MSTKSDRIMLKRLLWLFIGFCSVSILAGALRLSSADWNLYRCADVLRVRDILSMFLFAPVISVFFWLFYRCLSGGAASPAMDIICILAIFAVACGMGIHDPVNCLGGVYHKELADIMALKRSFVFIDDQLGHWVFWVGFVLGSWCIAIQQMLSPLDEKMSFLWQAFFAAAATSLLGVMLTNLWDEYPRTIGDLIVIAVAVFALFPAHLLLAKGVSLMRMPVLFVIYIAYIGSLVGTLTCWQFRYGIVGL